MQRINTTTKAVDLFGPGKDGFTAGDPVGGVPATRFSPEWCNSLQEEIAGVIEGAGMALDAGSVSQLIAAIRALSSPPAVQIFTASGTYNKPDGVKAILVEVVGAGGGSGGVASTSGTQCAASAGGGGGGYSRKLILAAALGETETVTIGAGGSAGATTPGAGGTGGTTSFGAHLQATGGSGGFQGNASTNTAAIGGASPGGAGSGGDLNVEGGFGGSGIIFAGVGNALGGQGASSMYSGITTTVASSTGGGGNNGRSYGGGASGAVNGFSQPARAGNAGGSGLVIITEFY